MNRYMVFVIAAIYVQISHSMEQAVQKPFETKVRRDRQMHFSEEAQQKSSDNKPGLYQKTHRYAASDEHKQRERELVRLQEKQKEQGAQTLEEAQKTLMAYVTETSQEAAKLEKQIVENTFNIWQIFQDQAAITNPKDSYAQLNAASKANYEIHQSLNDYYNLLNEYKNNVDYDEENPNDKVKELQVYLDALTTMDGFEIINPQVKKRYEALIKPKIEAKLKMVTKYDTALALVKLYQEEYTLRVAAIKNALKEAALEGVLGGGVRTVEKIEFEYYMYLLNKSQADWEILSTILQSYAQTKSLGDIEKDFPLQR